MYSAHTDRNALWNFEHMAPGTLIKTTMTTTPYCGNKAIIYYICYTELILKLFQQFITMAINFRTFAHANHNHTQFISLIPSGVLVEKGND